MGADTPTEAPTWVPTDWTWTPTVLGVPTPENGSKDDSHGDDDDDFDDDDEFDDDEVDDDYDYDDDDDVDDDDDYFIDDDVVAEDAASIKSLIAALEEEQNKLLAANMDDDDGALNKVTSELQANNDLLDELRESRGDVTPDEDDVPTFSPTYYPSTLQEKIDADEEKIMTDLDDLEAQDKDDLDNFEENVPTVTPTYFPSTLEEKMEADEENYEADIKNKEERPSLRPTVAPVTPPIPQPTPTNAFITFDDDDDIDEEDDDEFDDDDVDDDDEAVEDDDVGGGDDPTESPTYFPSFTGEGEDDDDEEVADEDVGILPIEMPGPPLIDINNNEPLPGFGPTLAPTTLLAPTTEPGAGSSPVVMEVTKEEIEYAAIGGGIAAVVLALIAVCIYFKFCRVKKGRSAKRMIEEKEERDALNLNGHNGGDSDGFHDEEEDVSNGNGNGTSNGSSSLTSKEFSDPQLSLDEELRQPTLLPPNKASKKNKKSSKNKSSSSRSSRKTNGFSDTPPEPQGPRNVV